MSVRSEDMDRMKLHVVAFQIPSPPTYGGVMDVFYRLRALKQAGVFVILHCFQYGGREVDEQLRSVVDEVRLYQRRMGWRSQLSFRPYIVASRADVQLLRDLQADDAPILFEGLHTCRYLNHPSLRNRRRWVRMHNVEHDYYSGLAKVSRLGWRRLYFRIESLKLRLFEPVLRYADHILAISDSDGEYFRKRYPKVPVNVMFPFYNDEQHAEHRGLGDFILYHGNFEVPENRAVADYIVSRVLPNSPMPIVIAGKAASTLRAYCDANDRLCFVCDPSETEMSLLMREAHVHLLLTFQPTGLKLKLLNALHQGAFVVANRAMLAGSGLEDACLVADDEVEILETLNRLSCRQWSDSDQIQREQYLLPYANANKLQSLLQILK
ncbi:MAG: hypothetical protein J5808_00410 [Paludibacteraceae bacterium]|nr:hypothetical protein [Paludibacteraceae bacterium]